MEYVGPDVLNMTRVTHIPSPIPCRSYETCHLRRGLLCALILSGRLLLLVGSECRISRQMNHYNEMNDIIGCFSSVFRHSAGDLDTPLPISVVSVRLWNSLLWRNTWRNKKISLLLVHTTRRHLIPPLRTLSKWRCR